MNEIAVVGAGYVGLVTGVCFSSLGLRVHFLETDPHKLARLRAGEVPFFEPGLAELMKSAMDKNHLEFHATAEELFERAAPAALFICVGTPARPDGSCDTRFIENATDDVLASVRKPCVLVLKSTVPVGTAAKIRNRIAEKKLADRVSVVNNPEFLREGSAVSDFLRPERVVLGGENMESLELIKALYEPLLRNGHPLQITNHETAELSKLSANLMLASRISVINQISLLANAVGADIKQVESVLKADSRIGPKYLYAGLGYGGSCFPKDVKSFIHACRENGVEAPVAEAVDRLNDLQKLFFLPEIQKRFPNPRTTTIALLGIAFKPDTDDIRESPALAITRALAGKGYKLVAYDPKALDNYEAWLAGHGLQGQVALHRKLESALRAANAVVLVTEWKEFQSLDLGDLKEHFSGTAVFDGKNIFNPDRIRTMGFDYIGVGRR